MADVLRRFGVTLAVVALIVLLAALYPAFRSEFNTFVLLRTVSIFAVVGLAQLANLAIGEFNLSIGTLGGLVVVTAGWVMEDGGYGLAVGIAVALGVGIAAGLLNGALTVVSGLSGFVVTLGTMSVFYGLALAISDATPFYDIPWRIGDFGSSRSGPLPGLLVPAVVAVICIAVFFGRSRSGRNVLAVGGSTEAAALAGISHVRARLIAFALSGLLVAIAALMSMSTLGSAQPSIGSTWILTSFAVPIIGGSALNGGRVDVPGAFVAALLIGLINNGIVLAKIDPYWEDLAIGIVVLAAVLVARGKGEAQARDVRIA